MKICRRELKRGDKVDITFDEKEFDYVLDFFEKAVLNPYHERKMTDKEINKWYEHIGVVYRAIKKYDKRKMSK